MADPAVSVIVVNFNSGPGLGACLRAARRADLSVQLVVVDNASSDDSLTCLDAPDLVDRVELVRNGSNLGFARAVNIGAERARGGMLLVLNPDCVVYPGAIAALCRTLRGNDGAGIVGGLVANTDGSEQRGCRRHEPTPARIARRMMDPVLERFGQRGNGIDRTWEPMPREVVEVDAVSGAFMLIARNIFEAIGGFDEGYFLHFEDLDICRRVRDQGFSVLFDPAALAIHFKSGSGGAGRGVIARHKHAGLQRYLGKFHPTAWLPWIRLLSSVHLWLTGLGKETPSGHGIGSTRDDRRILESLEQLLCDFEEGLVVVTGATSQVGDFLLPRLRDGSQPVLAVTRGRRAGRVEGKNWWVRPEFVSMLAATGTARAALWLQLAPIWLFQDFTRAVDGLRPPRVIAISSSSVVTKRDSAGEHDRKTVALLARGEEWTMKLADRVGARVTIFRPSMIYGNRNNRNVEFIRRWVRRVRFFPLVGAGTGMRQPLHADDLADACIRVVDKPTTFGRIYDLAGGETLEFREMVRRIFLGEALAPVLPRVPRGVLRATVAVASRLPGLGALNPEMVDRIALDLVFDNTPASRDFGFSPRKFNPVNDR